MLENSLVFFLGMRSGKFTNYYVFNILKPHSIFNLNIYKVQNCGSMSLQSFYFVYINLKIYINILCIVLFDNKRLKFN